MGCHSTKPRADFLKGNKLSTLDGGPELETPVSGRGRPCQLEKKLAESENEEYRDMMAFLAAVPLFQRLPKDQAPILASAIKMQKFSPGACVIKQGEIGSQFFVIRTGTASVLLADKDGGPPKEVAQLTGGDYFGEDSLLRSKPQKATVRATTQLNTMRIDRKKFQELALHERLHLAHRKAVGRKVKVATRAPCRKTAADRQVMGDAIRGNKALSSVVPLDDKRVDLIIDAAWTESIPAGEEIITQGDPVANYFYIVKSGSFEIIRGVDGEDRSHPRSVESVIKGMHRDTVCAGDSFGELGLLYSVPRAATARATESSVVWVIDREHFRHVLMSGEEDHLESHIKHLKSVPVLRGLSERERRAVAMAMTEMYFEQGDKVIRQGERGNNFYVLFEGEVAVVRDGEEQARLGADVERGKAHYFGERALITKERRSATVVVTSTAAKAMALDQDAFTLLLGPLERRFKQRESVAATPCCAAFLPCALALFNASGGVPRRRDATKRVMERAANEFDHYGGRRICRRDLKRIGLLGAGAFGSVELFEHVETGTTFAMKCLNKGHICQSGMQQCVMSERCILMMTKSPFIITLYETFNGAQTLYFLLEPALGGELHAIYHRKKLHGSEVHAKYYVGGVIFAFEHLHERRIVYRDLKPENLLLNEHGHLKVTDMGFAKFVIGKTYTTCGTPDYFAPELISCCGHSLGVDWWTLGVLLFELMVGRPPFEAKTVVETYEKVQVGLRREEYPKALSGSAGDLVEAMLQHEPPERLPMRLGGTKNLKDHPWYAGFNWASLEALEMEPPFLPQVRSNKDIANFSVRAEDMPKELPYRDDGSGWDKEFASST